MTPTPPIRSTRRLLAGLALVAALGLAAGGCGDDGDGEDQAQDGAQAQRDPSDLEPVELPEVNGDAEQDATEGEDGDGTVGRPNEPEPNVDLTGDPAAIWHEHQRYLTWLFKHPDPAKTDRLIHPENASYKQRRDLLRRYAEDGLWWTGAKVEVLNVETLWIQQDQTRAKIRVVDNRPGTSKLIDETGKVHDALEPSKDTTEYVLAREGPDEPWRVLSSEPVEGD